jgi:hypothetical protein
MGGLLFSTALDGLDWIVFNFFPCRYQKNAQ